MTPYVQIEDRHGAVASVYFAPDNNHEVHYRDNKGHDFYTENFDNTPIEKVEQSVLDWAEGRRSFYEDVC